ncbi:hypothetical protein HS088_TW03G00002 [Tripterygium wilfordii]|uniref:Transmembrane protein n=2 Tax=Tripterygium wilfordii TaxID=458696 RepID=A0A7J7DTN2_TRIWF|nr:hypothetical protein HS088_TW03G00002 [Tripterygium wilfordii]
MGTETPCRSYACVLWVLLFLSSIPHSFAPSNERSLVVGESSTLQLSSGFPIANSPGAGAGTSVVCERVHIHGLSRLKHLNKIAHSLKVKVSQKNSGLRGTNAEVCFHRNVSLGIGMCSQGQWEKVDKGSWARPMSPFYHKILDVRMAGSSLETTEVSIEEEFFLYRLVFLISGILLLTLASPLSKSLTFYYSSAMAIGVVLVILMVLFQGMKLLPSGRKNSLAIFFYSSVVGLGSFLLRYLPGLLHYILMEIGINEDMYNPLAIFLLAFVVLVGAWLGFWVVRKLVLTEDGAVDISTSHFVAWSIRVLAVFMILQSSLDSLLAAEALIAAIVISSVLRKVTRMKFLRHTFRKLLKLVKNIVTGSHLPDLSPFKYCNSGYIHNRHEDSNYRRPRSKRIDLASCDSPVQGVSSRTLTGDFSDSDTYASIIHKTPERRKFSRDEWEQFTRVCTKTAVEELVVSPGFGKWVAANAERITVTPNSAGGPGRRRRWLLWF